jgi:hypothetical protein
VPSESGIATYASPSGFRNLDIWWRGSLPLTPRSRTGARPVSQERSRQELEDALTQGQDNGWELINVYGVGTTLVLMIVWDTEPG